MLEAYSHEVSSCGFYSYTYPTLPEYADVPVQPPEASWNGELNEFVLPYEVVRTSPNLDETLTTFLQTTYEAAATTANWDRERLERRP